MPSYMRELLVEMLRNRPMLAAELLTDLFGVSAPAFEQARLSSGDLTDAPPMEYQAGAVITLTAGDVPVLGIVVDVVEVEFRRDVGKWPYWPVYVGTLYARSDCLVFSLVVCSNPVVEAWFGLPVMMSAPGWLLTPLLFPAEVPVVTDPSLAKRQPELAVLSAMAHGGRSGEEGVFDALLAALEVVDHDHAKMYADLVLAALPAAARADLETFMTTTTHRYQSDFARRYYAEGEAKGKAKGEAKGKAKAVLAFLDARGIEIPDPVREDIISCTDLDQLDTWIRRAATATKVQELFD